MYLQLDDRHPLDAWWRMVAILYWVISEPKLWICGCMHRKGAHGWAEGAAFGYSVKLVRERVTSLVDFPGRGIPE